MSTSVYRKKSVIKASSDPDKHGNSNPPQRPPSPPRQPPQQPPKQPPKK